MSESRKPRKMASRHAESDCNAGDCTTCGGPLDGTQHEGITANMGVMKYPLGIPIPVLLKQIVINKRRTKEAERPND